MVPTCDDTMGVRMVMSVVKKLEGIDARQFQKRVIKAGRINSTEDAI